MFRSVRSSILVVQKIFGVLSVPHSVGMGGVFLPEKYSDNQTLTIFLAGISVHSGQGEYIVFQCSPNGSESPNQSCFDRVYQIFLNYSFREMAARASDSTELFNDCAHRYDLIQNEVSSISSELIISFVPKVLFELIYLQGCIEENRENGAECPMLRARFLAKESPYELNPKYVRPKLSCFGKNCWHLSLFTHSNGNDQEEGVRQLAYRFNQRLIEILHPTKCGFDFDELNHFMIDRLNYFAQHQLSCQQRYPLSTTVEELNLWIHDAFNTSIFNFGYTLQEMQMLKQYGIDYSLLTISTQEEQAMCQTVLQQECSELAR